ncbi:GATA transcription factor 19-like [Asparagus officinalis]|uniref:GATA transcription factor 19-like n=1 Tax=Asparagus officinalis TaxID=4686 RepID=UPI00098E52A7|nr:GATA transcription factor 19-like [Asparagus officinalis]
MLINRSSPNSLCWDINNISADQPRAQRCYPSTATAPAFRSPAVNPASASSSNLGGSDPLLLARRCANCDTTSTPLWRNGPRGPKSLCNACGIRYKKEERRSAASTAAAANLKSATGLSSSSRLQQQYPWNSNSASSPWYQNINEDQHHHHHHQSPCLSWRLNVIPTHQLDFVDRPSLFQYQ